MRRRPVLHGGGRGSARFAGAEDVGAVVPRLAPARGEVAGVDLGGGNPTAWPDALTRSPITEATVARRDEGQAGDEGEHRL